MPIRTWKAREGEVILGILAVAIAVLVVGYPFTRSHYPAMMDMPMHASAAGILRHYGDPSFHFEEQFELHFLKVPYWTLYGLGAALAHVFSIATAMKLSAFLLLACLPGGLAVLFHGMKKSPLLGLVLGLLWVWSCLAHMGFLNFVAAVGMFCAAVGVTLLLVDQPSRKLQIALALVMVLIFATHIFRFPFAAVAVVGTTLLLYPATRRWKEPLVALAPSVTLFAVWYLIRDRDGTGPENVEFSAITWDRFLPQLLRKYLFSGFKGPVEARDANVIFVALAVVLALSLVGFFVERRWSRWTRRELLFHAGATTSVFLWGASAFGMYLTLPLQVGVWWWVYPRELVTAVVVATALCCDLPRPHIARAGVLLVAALAALNMSGLVAREYAVFDAQTEDFRTIARQIPPAPRLAYLIFDHSGTDFAGSPFLHLPAWVQAEKGGWLSFHFVSWNQSPIRYRGGSSAVPPPTPPRFEFTPDKFEVKTRGAFFDWFLVRSLTDPSEHLAGDLQVRRVAAVGRWWLYHREDGATTAP